MVRGRVNSKSLRTGAEKSTFSGRQTKGRDLEGKSLPPERMDRTIISGGEQCSKERSPGEAKSEDAKGSQRKKKVSIYRQKKMGKRGRREPRKGEKQRPRKSIGLGMIRSGVQFSQAQGHQRDASKNGQKGPGRGRRKEGRHLGGRELVSERRRCRHLLDSRKT